MRVGGIAGVRAVVMGLRGRMTQVVHTVQNDTKAPDITLSSVLWWLTQRLWCFVAWRTNVVAVVVVR